MSGLNLLFPFLSLFVIFTPSFTLVAGLSGCGPHHIQALVQFKNEFDSSGCNQTDYFNGVMCDNITGEVTKLQLPSGCFTGVLKTNSSLFGFNHLRYLNLSYNKFTSSSLSSGFGSLNKLEVLSLSSNGFIGQVPSSLSNLSRLTELYLDHNELTGAIPSSLLTMPFLSYLNLDENHLTDPVEVRSSSTSSRLETLHLRKNPFEGKILDLISNFTTLKYLGLSFQNISYPINLKFFSSLKSLLRLDLSGNSVLETSISSDSDVPRNIEKLLLSSCDISKFPKFVRSLDRLEHIDISNNKIKGKVPEWLWNLPHLIRANLVNNAFTHLEGSNDVLTNSSLRILDLALNHFEGPVPTPPLSINLFSAWNNSFTGNIPLSVCNRSSLVILDLSYNNLSGPIPRCLSNLKDSLVVVNLRKNNLEGSIPDMLYNGKVLTSYATIDFSGNRFEGQIPKSIGLLKALIALNLSNNGFTGHIPLSLENVTELESLDLSGNKLSGSIPKGLARLSFLAYISVAHNQLIGEIPQGPQFSGQAETSFEGNAGLCGLPLQGSCFAPPPTQQFEEEDEEEEEGVLNLKSVVTGYGLGLLFGLVIGHVIASYRPKWFVKIVGPDKHKEADPASLFDSLDSRWDSSSNKNNVESHIFTLVVGLSGCHPDQIQALKQFKNEFDSRNCNQTDYLNGVQCDNATGAVTELQLPSGCLTGVLKPNSSLFHLRHLRHLNLSHNNFTSSSLPSEFSNLSRLEVLSLSSNSFIGQVPSLFSKLTWLNQLDLSHNQLTGSFQLVQNLTKLSILDLSYNHFSGAIPSSLLSLPFLTRLDLSENYLTGSIEVLNSSSSLRHLSLSHNHFEGQILEPISNLITLKFLDISFLNISYPIDIKIFSSLKSLLKLVLSGNSISSTRSIPPSICNQSKLALLDLSYNNFSGSIPRCLSNLQNSLIVVNLRKNNLEGSLPDNCYDGALLRTLDVGFNKLTGKLPRSLLNCSSLKFLSVDNNNIKDTFPFWLKGLPNLQAFTLRSNRFYGKVLTSYATIDFSGNRLEGQIPESIEQSCFTPPTRQPKEEDEEEEEGVLNWKAVVIGYGPGLLFGLLLAHVIASYRPKWFVKIVGPDKHKEADPVTLFMSMDSRWDSFNNKKSVESNM
ncbi:unnamed protein product [Brassica rapa]|uniref:Leucine-rich repeat-containing N-terminal plant-type domain-containing protein n=1 Tax=Brassica campestris TaxID=3711 RepID=A0A3P5ZE33_BRACM|nr:unnamed protein product [Brassica rapa]VDC70478.1 unnamed protein product [Brassica rapa]